MKKNKIKSLHNIDFRWRVPTKIKIAHDEDVKPNRRGGSHLLQRKKKNSSPFPRIFFEEANEYQHEIEDSYTYIHIRASNEREIKYVDRWAGVEEGTEKSNKPIVKKTEWQTVSPRSSATKI